jgi:hypothetical protein
MSVTSNVRRAATYVRSLTGTRLSEVPLLGFFWPLHPRADKLDMLVQQLCEDSVEAERRVRATLSKNPSCCLLLTLASEEGSIQVIYEDTQVCRSWRFSTRGTAGEEVLTLPKEAPSPQARFIPQLLHPERT